MTGSENYKEFDTATIISRDTVSVGNMTFRKRDVVFGGIAVVALVIAIILAIVLAVEVGKKSGDCQLLQPNAASGQQTGNSQGEPSNSTGTGQGKDTTRDPLPTTRSPSPTTRATPPLEATTSGGSNCVPGGKSCISSICLKTAAYERSIMNDTVKPCENFYKFACGGYAGIYEPNPMLPIQSPFSQIQLENLQKMQYLLSYEPDRPEEHSYERKLRHFLSSCNNHFDKMQLGGLPLINKVIRPFGGWYVMDDAWDPSSFDFHKQFKFVHADYWTPAVFAIQLSTDSTDWTKKVLEITAGGLGLQYYYYILLDPGSREQALYTNYMKMLAMMLTIDAGLKINRTRVEQFASDVLEVETTFANLMLLTKKQEQPHAPANRISFANLTNLTGGTLDFLDYFKYQFPGVASIFTNDTTVAVLEERYFHLIGPQLKNYTSTNEGKRKLHNFLVWQLIHNYADDLSWEYIHAKRQLNYYIYGRKDDSSGYYACIQLAVKNMRDAFGAVFVKSHVNKMDRQEATAVLDMIKTELFTAIRQFNWMSQDNQESAIAKIRDSLYKIGYPDYMVNDTYMDSMYSFLNISDDDYFGNILSLNLVSRKKFTDLLATPNSRSLWAYHVFDPKVEYYNPWHELIATAAMFQNPLFAHNGPWYYNFGGIGTILASNLIHAIDAIGSQYKLDRTNSGSWWSDSTLQNYMSISQCAVEAQKDRPVGPFVVTVNYTYHVNMSQMATDYTPDLLASASGLKLTYKAYKARMASNGAENVPAGFPDYSLDKMFFLAFAQAHCDNTPDLFKARDVVYNQLPPSEYRVNLAVSHVQEFRDAFQCKAGDPMAPERTCNLF